MDTGMFSIHPKATCDGEGNTSSSSLPKASKLVLPAILAAFTGYGGRLSTLAPWAATYLAFSSLAPAHAQEEECVPSIELEISVPYDCPYNNFVDGRCMTPRMIADRTVQALFVDFDVEAAESLLAPGYIQHNPTVPTGATPVLGFLPALQNSGLEIEVHRTLEEGNLVAYHSTYTNADLFGGETLVGFDVFRVEDGKVQEHWDNLQPLAGPNPNGNTMVDGPTMVKNLNQTDANKELATSLVEAVLIGGNGAAAPMFISNETYTQHNPDIADGLTGIQEAFANLAAAGMLFTYDSIELVVAQGNFVLLGSVGEFGEGNPTAFYDLFRAEDGLLVEHWDVIQSIPPASEFAHENGKF